MISSSSSQYLQSPKMEDNSSGSPLQRMASITNALVSQPSQVHTSYLMMMMGVGLVVMMVMMNMVMKVIMLIIMTMIQVNFGTPNRPNLKNVLPPITQQQVFPI